METTWRHRSHGQRDWSFGTVSCNQLSSRLHVAGANLLGQAVSDLSKTIRNHLKVPFQRHSESKSHAQPVLCEEGVGFFSRTHGHLALIISHLFWLLWHYLWHIQKTPPCTVLHAWACLTVWNPSWKSIISQNVSETRSWPIHWGIVFNNLVSPPV